MAEEPSEHPAGKRPTSGAGATERGSPPDGRPTTGWRRLVVEPRRPTAVATSPWATWLVVGTVCVGAFMGQLDASIVTLAFPTLRRDFHTSLSAVQWVGQAYLLVLIAMLTAVGRFADMVGRKLLYLYGFLVFVLGSALCGLAPSLPLLVAARLLQGFGAAMLQANSVAIIVNAVASERLGRAIGVQGAAQALGLGLGPAVGGLLIGLGGWRLIFFVNVPAGLLGAAAGTLLIPRSRHLATRTPFDWVGLAIFVPAVSSLLLAVSYGDVLGWTSPATLGLFAAVVVLGTAFVLHERAKDAPMIDLGLFRKLTFASGIGRALLGYLVLFGLLTVVPFFLEDAKGASAAQSGLQLMVLPVGLGLAAPFAGRAADWLGARPLLVAGTAVTTTCLVLLAVLLPSTGGFLALLGLAGAGLGMVTAPNNAAVMGAAPRSQSGMASGVLNMTRGLGTSLGLALTGLVYTLVAGPGEVLGSLVADGFRAAAGFLAGVAALALLLSLPRTAQNLETSPAALAE